MARVLSFTAERSSSVTSSEPKDIASAVRDLRRIAYERPVAFAVAAQLLHELVEEIEPLLRGSTL